MYTIVVKGRTETDGVVTRYHVRSGTIFFKYLSGNERTLEPT